MLIQFRFKNFKSFKDDTIFDLSATKITEHNDRVFCAGKEKMLPVAAIFGANASGKSNLIEAFRYMTEYVMNSFSYGGESDTKKTKQEQMRRTPFLFDKESKEDVSSFEVYFIDSEEHGSKLYNYGFTINNSGVVEEWLNEKSKTAKNYKLVFYRNEDDIDLSGLPEKSRENVKVSLERETLIASLGAKLKISKLKTVREWFCNNEFANFGNPYENAYLSSLVPDGFATDKSVQDKVVAYFSSFDPSIIGFDVEVIKEDGLSKIVKIHTLHRSSDGGTALLPFEEESDGTLKMFSLYGVLQDTLNNGAVLFIDELNARLHPLLVRTFLITFLNPDINTNHAQLVFTTHDSWQLSNNLLRRDEIWFTEKRSDGASVLYSLADFIDEDGSKIRKDESYEKNYLLGKYGAIPTLKYFDIFKEE